jgi:tRNA A37 threonylcarbamoyladenosine synthetase subunit TsaC/SUA5/YrdC
VLREGGIVALPTDTVCNLVASRRPCGGRRVRTDIARPADAAVRRLARAGGAIMKATAARRLARRFWPGALTIVLRKGLTTRASRRRHHRRAVPADPFLREAAPARTARHERQHRRPRYTAPVRAQLGVPSISSSMRP